jgi:hypothetical protein
MAISEQELRSMIREAIARTAQGATPREARGDHHPDGAVHVDIRVHASHGLFPVAPSGDGECIIEPAVRCNHCGYCKSLGH